jgi:hypothetical protein
MNLVYPERSRRELQNLNFIKKLIYLLLFSLFLLISLVRHSLLSRHSLVRRRMATATVAKKIYEIRATNYYK